MSKWNSWDDEPAEPCDDWMKPFDEIIAAQASKSQNEAPVRNECNDGWNLGFDDLAQDNHRYEPCIDAAYTDMQQLDGGAMQSFPASDCQPPLYTDGETVYMMMCVEMPDPAMEQ